jgi:hypothetical protein
VRIVVQLEPEEEGGWLATISQSPAPAPGRPVFATRMRHLRESPARDLTGDGVFPLPPVQEVEELGDNHDRSLFAPADPGTIETLLSDFAAKSSRQSGTGRLGRYLFLTLLGDACWSDIRAAAGQEPIELSIAARSEHARILRLPWETMYASAGGQAKAFLAGEAKIAITRTVLDGARTFGEIHGSPRILFVVGCELNDGIIWPAAEYLGMLRASGDTPVRLKTKLLSAASLARMKTVIAEYRPHVVHFIGHGDLDAEGRPFVWMMEESAAAPAMGSKCVQVNGDALADVLQSAGPTLQMVVLNACRSAQSGAAEALDPERSVPLAMRLASAGAAPLVVGMAGRISDPACRLFTRCLYEALGHGTDLVQACAFGRRGGMIQASGTAPENSVDWALPTIYVAASASGSSIKFVGNPQEAIMSEAARKLEQFGNAACLDRLHVMKQFDEVLDPGDPQCLILRSDLNRIPPGRSGRSFLLWHLARKAAREGDVPCVLSLESSDFQDRRPHRDACQWIENQTHLAAAFRHVMIKTAMVFEVLDESTCRYLDSMVSKRPLPQGSPQPLVTMFNKLGNGQHDFAPALAMALQFDTIALLKAIRFKVCPDGTFSPRMVFFIDDVHAMAPNAYETLLTHFIGEPTYGLRSLRDQTRVVLSMEVLPDAVHDVAAATFREFFKTWFSNRPGVKSVPLGPFDDGELHLACQQLLLNWVDLVPTTTSAPRTFHPVEAPNLLKKFLGMVKIATKKYPSNMQIHMPNDMRDVVDLFSEGEGPTLIVNAPDEQIIRQCLVNGGSGAGPVIMTQLAP